MSVLSVYVGHFHCRASCLGDHAVLHTNSCNTRNEIQPIKFESIDQERFSNIIAQHKPPSLSEDVHQDVTSVCVMLYVFSRQCQTRRRVYRGDANTERWERFMECGDEVRVWYAIDWSGKSSDDAARVHSSPSDSKFNQHFDEVLGFFFFFF